VDGGAVGLARVEGQAQEEEQGGGDVEGQGGEVEGRGEREEGGEGDGCEGEEAQG
jgi:hypothetical protein